MKELNMQVPVPDLPKLGLPYTWGPGRQWYVSLQSGTYVFTEDGLKYVGAKSEHRTNYQNFRYATTIRFTDCTDE